MSDTPRVDAAEIRHGKEGYSYLTVSVEFARQLERELCRLTADNKRLREAIEAYIRAENSDGGEIGGFFPKPPTMAHQRRVYLAWQELNAALRRKDVT
jgi:hypothetical protein